MSGLFDPGLQPERTELAWRRTALALGVGSLIAMRLLPAEFGDVTWTLVGAAGLAVSGGIWLLARRRYRAVNDALRREGDRAHLPGAALLVALALFVAAIGPVALAIVLIAAG